MTCPSCGAEASGRFCSHCGAPLEGAACASCRSPLTPGAGFCHRCGTPVHSKAPRSAATSNALPWSVAGIALLALIALAAGQRFGRSPAAQSEPGAAGRASDISAMSPAEQAERLYDRIMSASERGRTDSVQFFLPMALQVYASLGPLNLDQRYDLGRLAEIGGDARLASAQADSILRSEPNHLLGLLLASRAARLRGDERAATQYLRRLAGAETKERARQLPEYQLHQNDINKAVTEWRQRGSR